ncbi:hypothetical protein DFP72DRAFT_924406 [Ephemerocybe angulata]|uniref:Uncharacterized protein n=1 Tax=Ephemerocybe angulata TaxID=980116 RepID=A0A8H6HGI2_9AGAR|nr:hypothetical protein DFP72DRAFT_924406 [Tulosesus angulatus]
MLEPEGFYDAIIAYGLPREIIDLDRSAQSNVPYQTFLVNGVCKQGGSLSPLKCTLTSSMANRWLSDLSQGDPGRVVIQSHSGRSGLPHTPFDSLQHSLTMVEAMDDSLLFRFDLFSSDYSCALCRSLSTSWPKSCLYAYRTADFPSEDGRVNPTALVPSVDISDPTLTRVKQNEVPLTRSHTTFLRSTSFTFPHSSHRLPLTAIKRVFSQLLFSKIRPRLNAQPINPIDAESLDHAIASKVHTYLGMPFRFRSYTLHSPVNAWGMGFLSVARLNELAAVNGLLRDLNHHIPIFTHMSRTTLSDWSCTRSDCRSPFTSPVPRLIKTEHLKKSIPYHWIIAQDTFRQDGWTLPQLDQSHIFRGEVAITHLSNNLPPQHRLPKRLLNLLAKHGYCNLADVGTWIILPSPHHQTLCIPRPAPTIAPQSIKGHWPRITDWTAGIHRFLHTFLAPDPTVIIPPKQRQVWAEDYLLGFSSLLSRFHDPQVPIEPHYFASDASKVPLSSPFDPFPLSSVTFSSVSHHTSSTWSLQSLGPDPSTAEGEAFGILLNLLLASSHPTDDPIILSDHLSSVKFLNSRQSLSHLSLHRHPLRHIYLWILDILSRFQSPPSLLHVKAHTSSTSLHSNLNHIVDYYASHSHLPSLTTTTASSFSFHLTPCVPVPTFFLDTFTPFSPRTGFISTRLQKFVDAAYLHRNGSTFPSSNITFPPSLYDPRPPPLYPYHRAVSSFSAVVQLYARSAQLDSGRKLAVRTSSTDGRCRFGCLAEESSHHIFVECPRFFSIRHASTDNIISRANTILNVLQMDLPLLPRLSNLLHHFLEDGSHWPAQRSFFYLGLVPKLDPLLHHHQLRHLSGLQREKLAAGLNGILHQGAILCAGRIWGIVRRRSASSSPSARTESDLAARIKELALPSFLSYIPSSSPFLRITSSPTQPSSSTLSSL